MEANNPEFPRRLYTKGEEPFPAKSIGYYSNDTKLFDELYTALRPDEWNEIRDSQLGVFLQFNRLNFEWASRLVHFMLGFQLVCNKKYEIWSLVGSNPVRFSLNEFEVITGLNCEDVQSLELPEVELTDEMEEFWEKLGVNPDSGPSIDQLTAACKVAGSWDNRIDRIRLGYLAIFAGFIEARKQSTPTRVNLARLVMDLDRFLNYPWGRVAFKNLILSVKDKDLTKSSYTIDGFVEALQIWVYEAMPDFAKEIGDPLPNKPTPPLLAYRGSRGRRNVKEAILKQVRTMLYFVQHCLDDYSSLYVTVLYVMMQTRFNNLLLTGGTISPVWEDDEPDDKIDNILRAIQGEFGTWKWQKRLWDPVGIKVTNNVKVEDKGEKKRPGDFEEASGKRHCPGPSADMGLGFNLLDSLKQELNGWGSALMDEIRVGFSCCESRFDRLNSRIEDLAAELKGLSSNLDATGVKQKPSPSEKDKTSSQEEQKSPFENENNANQEEQVTNEEPVKADMNNTGQSQSVKGQSTPIVPQPSPPKEMSRNDKSTPLVTPNVRKEKLAGDDTDSDPFENVEFVRTYLPTLTDLAEKSKKQEPRVLAARLLTQAKVERQKRLAASQRSPWIGNSTAKTIISNVKSAPDPFDKPDTGKKKDLLAFLKQDPTFNKRKLEEKSRSCLWWYELRTKTVWLRDSHMDAILNLYRQRYTQHPEWFRSDRLAFLDAMFSQMWSCKYSDFSKSDPLPDGSGKLLPPGAFDYHAGSYPPMYQTRKQWGVEVDDIYAPLNVKKCHWVALWISIPQRHIVVWDSIPVVTSDEELKAAIEPISVMLPYVMRTLASNDIKDEYTYEPYTHERVTDGVPLNELPGDCGVYALKYIECHALGLPFPETLCDRNIPWIREKIACDIFHDTGCRGPNDNNYLDDFGLYDATPGNH